jgi:hypothetical protein
LGADSHQFVVVARAHAQTGEGAVWQFTFTSVNQTEIKIIGGALNNPQH